VRAVNAPERSPFAAARSNARLSQLELALRAGTTQRHLSFLERGRSKPGSGLVIRSAQRGHLDLD
jgi:transcriptional regulator with XRE-family HTH domain